MKKREGTQKHFLQRKGVSNLSVRGRLRLGPHLQSKEEAIPGIPGWDSLTERSRKLELAFSLSLSFFFSSKLT